MGHPPPLIDEVKCATEQASIAQMSNDSHCAVIGFQKIVETLQKDCR
jgi:hypothetical protein